MWRLRLLVLAVLAAGSAEAQANSSDGELPELNLRSRSKASGRRGLGSPPRLLMRFRPRVRDRVHPVSASFGLGTEQR